MQELVALSRTGSAFVESLEQIWERGDAVLPIDPRLPSPAREQLLSAMAPTRLIDGDGVEHRRNGRPVETGDALVIATSGSSGIPKGVVHTHASLRASAESTSLALGVDMGTDSWLCCLPLTHIAGIAIVVRAKAYGVPLVVLDQFDASSVEEAARQGATLTSLVPATLLRIDPSLFRSIIVGGQAVPADLPSNCRASYGMTETGSAVVFDGEILPGVELQIEHGEIQVRGDMLLRCYRDGTDPRSAGGWFPTNDAGELVDGRLVVHGRRGDLIISGGENIWPSPIEEVLGAMKAIKEVAIIGRPDSEWGQVVTAIIAPVDPLNLPRLDQIREHVKSSLPAYCAPHRIEFVDQLPRTPLGKVERKSL
ncbi:MAG: AMP-binding protein [Acidimicrobiales bacterium]